MSGPPSSFGRVQDLPDLESNLLLKGLRRLLEEEGTLVIRWTGLWPAAFRD
jgi:hypothetical protein